ncbi:hypothetical protein [Halomicrococcus sp. NG-SE-24]|uniref:hypothetical protein n=1 Tax=Halomicrococcus sp. NG-SE-24 TaxID=3436928 RepID=UPI003D985F01
MDNVGNGARGTKVAARTETGRDRTEAARVAPLVVTHMATKTPDRDAPITESRAYRRLQFLKLLLTVVTLVVTIWKALTGSVP